MAAGSWRAGRWPLGIDWDGQQLGNGRRVSANKPAELDTLDMDTSRVPEALIAVVGGIASRQLPDWA